MKAAATASSHTSPPARVAVRRPIEPALQPARSVRGDGAPGGVGVSTDVDAPRALHHRDVAPRMLAEREQPNCCESPVPGATGAGGRRFRRRPGRRCRSCPSVRRRVDPSGRSPCSSSLPVEHPNPDLRTCNKPLGSRLRAMRPSVVDPSVRRLRPCKCGRRRRRSSEPTDGAIRRARSSKPLADAHSGIRPSLPRRRYAKRMRKSTRYVETERATGALRTMVK